MPKSSKRKINTQMSVVLVVIGVCIAGLFSVMKFDPVSDFLNDVFGVGKLKVQPRPATGTVQVHFIDVGQGDSALIVTADNAVLIDGGEVGMGDNIADYIRSRNVSKLDLVIATHPHSDHVGGLDKVLEQIEVDELIYPEMLDEHTSRTFERMLLAANNKNVKHGYAQAGKVYELGDTSLEIISCGGGFKNANDISIVARLTHGENTFLFTGDIEKKGEEAAIDTKRDLSADVLKAPHHGSNTSSSPAFLKKVKGKFAVVSVGKNNSYNHPSPDTISRLEQMGYTVLRTDKKSTVIFISTPDGLKYDTYNK